MIMHQCKCCQKRRGIIYAKGVCIEDKETKEVESQNEEIENTPKDSQKCFRS